MRSAAVAALSVFVILGLMGAGLPRPLSVDPATGEINESVVFPSGKTLTVPVVSGSTVANGDLALQGTTHATRTTSVVSIQPSGGATAIGNASQQATVTGSAVAISAPVTTVNVTGVYEDGVLLLDGGNGVFTLGDVGGTGNDTKVVVDDSAGTISLAAANGITFGGGGAVKKVITTTTTWNPGSINAGDSETKSGITMTGVAVGDVVTAALTTITGADWAIQACVTATNTVEVRITNNTGGVGPVDLASGTLRVNCIKF